MPAAIAFPGLVLTLAAFVLFLMTTISTPIWKSLYFLDIFARADATGSIHLGTLGYCSTGISVTFDSRSVTIPAGCTATKLGYALDSDLFADAELLGINLSGFGSGVVKSLSYTLVLQPIAAGFALLTLVFAFFAFCCRSRGMEIFTFVMTIISSIVAWIAWGVAMALFTVARNRIRNDSDGFLDASYGNALWMSLAAAIVMTIAICTTCAGMFGPYRKDKDRGRYERTDSGNNYPQQMQQYPQSGRW